MATINKFIKKKYLQIHESVLAFYQTRNKLPLLLLVLFSLNSFGQTYIPPIGIPDPEFGINESCPDRPISWVSEIAGYYYINNQMGSDANTYGTPLNPRRSIPNPIPAGSYVEINGIYNQTQGGNTKIYSNGTSESWVASISGPAWVVGKSQQNRAEFTTSVLLLGEYLYLDSIYFHSGGRLSMGSPTSGYPAHHMMLRNSEIKGQLTDGNGMIATANGSEETPSSHIIYYNNEFHQTGDIINTPEDVDIDAHVMGVGGYTSYVWFLDNIAHNASGAGLQVNGRPPSSETHHIYVGRNEVYNVRQAGLWVKYGQDVVFSENYIHDIYLRGGKGIGAQYEPIRFWMLNNIIHDVHYGIRLASTSGSVGDVDIYAIGNIIYDIQTESGYTGNSSWDNAAIHLHGATNRYIINNTIYNAPSGITSSSTSSTNFFVNNIVSNINEANGNHIWVEYNLASAQLNNSLIYQSSGNEKIKWGSNVYTVDEFETAYPSYGQGNLIDDPLFVDAPNNNFNLQSTSPAIDTGVLSSVYQTFYDLYGIDINVDFNGTPRPQGSAWDIGAFEFESTLSINDEIFDASISIFPNPTNDTLTIDLKNSNLKKIVIYNELGQQIKEVTTKEVDISSLSQGIYFFKIISQNGKITTKKIIKN